MAPHRVSQGAGIQFGSSAVPLKEGLRGGKALEPTFKFAKLGCLCTDGAITGNQLSATTRKLPDSVIQGDPRPPLPMEAPEVQDLAMASQWPDVRQARAALKPIRQGSRQTGKHLIP